MGSPKTEAWRSDDETQHTVTVSDFYMAPYEVTHAEYEVVMGNNPSNFAGSDLPVAAGLVRRQKLYRRLYHRQ